MKNNILIFLLGVFVTISIAATIPNTGLITFKPATPKSVIVLQSSLGTMDDTQSRILSCTKQGYIVRSTVGVNSKSFIIMEKY